MRTRRSANRIGNTICAAIVVVLTMGASLLRAQQKPPVQDSTAARQARDSTTRARTTADSIAHLAAVRVRGSIAPTAAPDISSGVPARISTVGAAELRMRAPRLLVDAMASMPGVSFSDDLGSPVKRTMAARGFSIGPTVGISPGLSVFVDGIRQNEPDAQQVNFDLLPLDHVERIEFLRGSASMLGANGLGGAVNLITRRGEGEPGAWLQLSSGSFGARSGEAGASGHSSNGTRFYVGATASDEDGWREATSATRRDLFLNVEQTSAMRGARIQLFGVQSRAHTAGSLPEDLFLTAPHDNFTSGDFEDLSSLQLSASGYTSLFGGEVNASMFGRRSLAERYNVNQAPDPAVRSFTRNLSMGGTVDWRWSTALSPLRGQASSMSVRVGVDGAANDVRARIFVEPENRRDSAMLTTDVRSPGGDVAAFAIGDVRIGIATISGGLRYDHVLVPYQNHVDPDDRTRSVFDNVAPRIGLSVRPSRTASWYASLGKSFRAPAILELGCADPDAACPLPFALGDDPPLRAVRATTIESGGQWLHGSMLATASLYRIEVRDEIFFVASEAARLAGYFTNLPRTRREGVELSVKGEAMQSTLHWYASYTFTRATFRSDMTLFSARTALENPDNPYFGANRVRVGASLPLVPRQQWRAGIATSIRNLLDLGVDTRYIGAQWARGDEANETTPLSAYAVADAHAALSWREHWNVRLVIDNVFGTRAATFGTFNEDRRTGEIERFLTPLSIRNVRLSIERQFGSDASQ